MEKTKSIRVKAYLMEAAGLFGFVFCAGLISIFLEHPDLPVMQGFLKDYPMLRRVPSGILLGIYIFLISNLFGEKSGAQINPAVTWTFFRLGKISFKDAVWYTIAQFAGAITGAQLIKLFFNAWFSHEKIHYGITKPQPPHNSLSAITAEFIISFTVMWTILYFSSLKKLEKKLPLMMGIWICIFLIVELPFSGMSLNPARSFAGAFAGNKWEHLWIYFLSPVLSMLLAGELYIKWSKKKIQQNSSNDFQEVEHYPTAD